MGVGVAFGLVLPMVEGPADGLKPTWLQIRAMAERAEQLGFDTVWTATRGVHSRRRAACRKRSGR